ncbi:MAG: phosphoribosylamine--glycine ligase [Planctomycetota bacterium]
MKLLVVGSGGREHALVRKLAESPLVETIHVTPGNPGTDCIEKAINHSDIGVDDLDGIVSLAVEERINLAVIGPEAPLVAGLGDMLRAARIPVFGPNRKGAQLEGSKIWAKELMRKHGIPTAGFRVFDKFEHAETYMTDGPLPVVIKADGLAAGKGVVVVREREQGIAALRRIMEDKEFGAAGNRVLIEDCLSGPEVSVLAITDGRSILTLPSAQDHKPVYDGDKGPNTGGMGAVSPAKALTPQLQSVVESRILVPVVHALRSEEIDFRGVIYAGLMLTVSGPRVLEFNVRFGDPETQPIIARMTSDLLPVLQAAANGHLEDLPDDALMVDKRAAVCVVMASGGYPGSYEKGHPISGIDDADAIPGVHVLQAGTAWDANANVVTAGGRVLGVTGLGNSVGEARKLAYDGVAKISFKDAHYRKDIAAKG